jgi:predicted metal-dependent peptidase
LNHIFWALDISCSVTDAQVKVFNSEVAHVHNTYSPDRTTLVSFDTEVCDVYEFDGDTTFEGLKFTGRGCTDLEDVFAKARAMKPEVMIVFTDLGCRMLRKDEEPPFPVVWLCVDNPNATVEFGKLIHFNSK